MTATTTTTTTTAPMTHWHQGRKCRVVRSVSTWRTTDECAREIEYADGTRTYASAYMLFVIGA